MVLKRHTRSEVSGFHKLIAKDRFPAAGTKRAIRRNARIFLLLLSALFAPLAVLTERATGGGTESAICALYAVGAVAYGIGAGLLFTGPLARALRGRIRKEG